VGHAPRLRTAFVAERDASGRVGGSRTGCLLSRSVRVLGTADELHCWMLSLDALLVLAEQVRRTMAQRLAARMVPAV
jgi:hypothetical protein